MVEFAAVTAGTWAPIALAVAALVGAVFAALRFNRDDATAVVAQQSTVLSDMRSLNEELASAATRVRLERDELLARIVVCTAEVAALRVEIVALKASLEVLVKASAAAGALSSTAEAAAGGLATTAETAAAGLTETAKTAADALIPPERKS